MRKWLLFFLLLGCLFLPSAAGAQGGLKLQSINIELWSEYDQPNMLVIHEFTVDPNTPLPAEVTVRFPKDGNLTAVAYLEDTLVNMDFEGPEAEGAWQIVILNVQSYAPHRIEYYQPLVRNGKERSFAFRWIGDYAVEEFNVGFQIPADSTNVVTTPPVPEFITTDDGLHQVGILTQNDLRMGQANEFTISYERDPETVTRPSNSENIQPSAPVGPTTEGRVSIDNLPWIIGGFGLVLIALALYFYWRSTQVTEQKSRRRRHTGSPEEPGGELAYCHECGTRAQPGDRFCRTCGSKLRV